MSSNLIYWANHNDLIEIIMAVVDTTILNF